MEIILFVAIVAIGAIWYFNAQRQKTEVKTESTAPYKVETPPVVVNEVVPTAPVVETAPTPVKKTRAPRVGEKAAKTAKAADKLAKKAPAKKKTSAVTKK